MRIIKRLTTQIDIRDPRDNYSGALDDVIKNKIRSQFVGICAFQCFIIDIVKIVRRSEPIIDLTAGTGQTYIHVQFDAEVLEYGVGEGFISKVSVIEKDRYILTNNDDNNTASVLARSSNIKVVKQNQYIPIRCIQSSYNLGKNSISVNGTFYFIPQNPQYVFEIDELSHSDKKEISPLLEEIHELETIIKKKDPKTVKFFNEMLYPFKKNKTSSFNTVDIKKLNATGFICRHERIDKLTPFVEVLKNVKSVDPNLVKKHPAKLVYMSILNDYKLHMIMVINLCQTFKSSELRKSHENIWLIYKQYKVD